MKIKDDFVTNSSSSSFIVAFPEIVTSLNMIKDKILFIEKAQRVFDDILEQQPMKISLIDEECIDRITREIESGWFPGNISVCDLPEADKFYDCIRDGNSSKEDKEAAINGLNKLYEEIDKINYQIAKEIAITFMKENEGKYVYFFSYSDNDGEFETEMEHGETFRKFKHIQISHH